jgi:glycosyltransferase involved in cell wall biosynthesis
LLEGIGAGLPVITTRTGNVPEVELLSKSILVIPNQYKNNLSLQPQEILQLGRVTSPGNLEELVEAIIMLSGNLNELTNIARSNACQFRELYGLLRFVGDHSKLYREGLLPEYST